VRAGAKKIHGPLFMKRRVRGMRSPKKKKKSLKNLNGLGEKRGRTRSWITVTEDPGQAGRPGLVNIGETYSGKFGERGVPRNPLKRLEKRTRVGGDYCLGGVRKNQGGR